MLAFYRKFSKIFLVYLGAFEITLPLSWDAYLIIFGCGDPLFYFPYFIFVNSMENSKIGIKFKIKQNKQALKAYQYIPASMGMQATKTNILEVPSPNTRDQCSCPYPLICNPPDHYEWTKFLLAFIYRLPRRHSNSSKTFTKKSEKFETKFYDHFRTSWII